MIASCPECPVYSPESLTPETLLIIYLQYSCPWYRHTGILLPECNHHKEHCVVLLAQSSCHSSQGPGNIWKKQPNTFCLSIRLFFYFFYFFLTLTMEENILKRRRSMFELFLQDCLGWLQERQRVKILHDVLFKSNPIMVINFNIFHFFSLTSKISYYHPSHLPPPPPDELHE